MKTLLSRTIENALPTHMRRIASELKNISQLTPEQRQLRKLQNADYSNLPLLTTTEESIHCVEIAAKSVYGDNWNFYSNALRREVVKVFESCVQRLSASNQAIDYCEIGSCQGLSMSIFARLLKDADALGRLVSIDPYFSEGYVEGLLGIWKKNNEIIINIKTKENAYKLYNLLQIEVEHIEEISSVGLKKMVCENQRFNLIYIDGSHEGMNPLKDLGFSLDLIVKNGIIVLDDHHWQDVKVIKDLLDRHGFGA